MFEGLRRYLRYTSWPVIGAMVALLIVGVVAIRTSEGVDVTLRGHSGKQIAFGAIGLGVFVVATLIPYRRLGPLAYPLFALTLGLLVLVLFLPAIRDARRWIDLKVIQLQPSEVAKLTYILMLAWYLRERDNYRRLTGLIVPFVLTLIPAVLILKEPDLGTSLLLFPTLFFMLFVAGAKLKHLLGVLAVVALLLFTPLPQARDNTMGEHEWRTRQSLAYWAGEERIVTAAPLAKMKNHQIQRIAGWLRPDDDTSGRSFQLYWSRLVLGSGHVSGRGDWNNADDYFRVLPDDHTDFIFSVIGGQWGFLGCLGVLACYGVIFLAGIEIALATYDGFGRLLAVGVLALLLSQIFINVGMTTGLMPITGMTLPLVSYGGSSLVVNCAALGLLVNVGQRRPILLGKRPFEYGERKPKPPRPVGPLSEDREALRNAGRATAPGRAQRPPTASGG